MRINKIIHKRWYPFRIQTFAFNIFRTAIAILQFLFCN
jgi:hypothetical protein